MGLAHPSSIFGWHKGDAHCLSSGVAERHMAAPLDKKSSVFWRFSGVRDWLQMHHSAGTLAGDQGRLEVPSIGACCRHLPLVGNTR